MITTMTIFYRILGLLALGVGILGAFLPVLPTTVFVLVAAWCFAKSSPNWHARLRNSRLFGKTLRDWEDNKTIAEKPYRIAVISMLACALLSVLLLNSVWAKLSVLVLIVIGILFVRRYRERS